MQAVFSEIRLSFNHPLFVVSPASKFDERKDAECGRLDGRRVSIEIACSRSIKGDFVRRSRIPHREVVHARSVRERTRSGALSGAPLVVVQLKLTADVRAPNITGSAPGSQGGQGYSGALYRNGTTPANNAGGGTTDDWLTLDASRSDDTYGSSTTVQPASVRLMPLIKI